MIGACSFLRKKSQHSDAAFYSHWLNVHGPLAAQLHGVNRYLQNHFIVDSPHTNDLARSLNLNGLAEMWFENETDRQICYDSKQEKVCDVDSLLFIGASARVVTDVTPVIRPREPARGERVFLFTGDDPRDLGDIFKAIAGFPGVIGVTDHVVTKPGAEPTQEREAVQIKVSRIVTVTANDPGILDRAHDVVIAGGGDSIAVFDSTEHYLI
ncbi:EthD family reductase [Mesorhizobium sp. YC-39]|uniref:EthD domain-containing protein n=1 Tax=unclassified Mesorhizobium TaxID=325217 RepID=UPI0021E8A000|nr:MULTISPECIES: EthD domain-containing protein [unclassified Mesorhizobium]MCV3205618.1 EthD family reductase [Mesorhizobium sp. YC-2]MCV3227983.1 EthD family reductase [Mesorhizobium sp. YC-39]